MVVAVSSDAKGLYALGILSHEASIIAAKESAEMKTIEFFIPRKLLLTALDIQSYRAGILEGQSSPSNQALIFSKNFAFSRNSAPNFLQYISNRQK